MISSGQNCVQWAAQNGKQHLVCPCLAASDNEITPLLSLFWNVSNRRVTSVTYNLDSILKSRDFTLPTKVRLVKAMVFPVVMYGCESWTIKKAERQRIDAFELWCLRRLLRVLWTARRSSKSIPKEISPEYSLEGLMLKLKRQCFGHLMRRTDLFENSFPPWKWTDSFLPWWWERLKAGVKGDNRGWDG